MEKEDKMSSIETLGEPALESLMVYVHIHFFGGVQSCKLATMPQYCLALCLLVHHIRQSSNKMAGAIRETSPNRELPNSMLHIYMARLSSLF